eukprot:TRINITY_DN26965_c0_g1_i3.p1 TRINITY_DN26965_c0_g1~~TRINITY_DN26965_c0_g1_i3.p1  ORF type:complete len:279 (-),score=36.84 TRINITY_DN26965_c0_g1_i3:156-992(-)
MTGQLDWLLRCCTRDAQDGRMGGEIQSDSYDITFTPRVGFNRDFDMTSTMNPVITPRQRHLRDQLELPWLQHYPSTPGNSLEEPEEPRRERLLEMYREFVLEMFAGTYLTQLTSSRTYSDIHCQLMEDLETLKLDQCNGRIIEFPLTSVSKVYRIVKTEGDFCSPAQAKPSPSCNVEHIVVVEFMRRKLAFVFNDLVASQRFLLCMELIIRHAHQARRSPGQAGGGLGVRGVGKAVERRASAPAGSCEPNVSVPVGRVSPSMSRISPAMSRLSPGNSR